MADNATNLTKVLTLDMLAKFKTKQDVSNYNKFATKEEVAAIPRFAIQVVASLPTENISDTTVYLVTNGSDEAQNLYDEYIHVNEKWEKLGTAKVDLSNYATKDEVTNAVTKNVDYKNIQNAPTALKNPNAITLTGTITGSYDGSSAVTIDTSNVATKDEVSAIPKFAIEVVTDLPTKDISGTTVYLVTNGSTEDSNMYDEYIYVNSKWEKLGTAKVDLTPYAKSADLAKVATSGSYNDLSDTPDALKNPNALTFTGAVTDTYDGGEAKTINIPVYGDMKGATADAAGANGFVPAPEAGKQGAFLRGDGTWAVPTDTTYEEATQSANGLMSAADKTKLDGIVSITEAEIDALFDNEIVNGNEVTY